MFKIENQHDYISGRVRESSPVDLEILYLYVYPRIFTPDAVIIISEPVIEL